MDGGDPTPGKGRHGQACIGEIREIKTCRSACACYDVGTKSHEGMEGNGCAYWQGRVAH